MPTNRVRPSSGGATRNEDEQRKAEEAKMDADEKHRAQKHEELGAWYRAECKKLEETRKAKYKELERSKYDRASRRKARQRLLLVCEGEV